MAIQRAAVIFDDEMRPETTGVYCVRALKQLVAAEHIRPRDLARVQRQDFDLFLNVDDGLRYHLPATLRPSAFWAIDTHLDFERSLEKSREFDFVFAAQRDGAERLLAEGIDTAQWLPLACDPGIHCPHRVSKTHDVVFIGNLLPGQRTELVALLCRHFASHFVGRLFFDEMARAYSASRAVFNCSVRNDINMRVFEALACGSLLVTNDLIDNGQTDLFCDGTHLVTYRDADELLDKLCYYLSRDALRARIEARGRQEVLAKHTYWHRMERLLHQINQRVPSARPSTVSLTNFDDVSTLDRGGVGTDADLTSEHVVGTSLIDSSELPHCSNQPYFNFVRPELMAMVPRSARRVLEIGCAAGRLGEALKARQSVEVVGIEMNESAASQARERLDRVIVGDVESIDLGFAPGTFDCVVCGDVLEHLRDPGAVLQCIRSWLTVDGRLVASIPNVRHHSVVGSLLAGNWTYEPAGLLDNTHLRFFTRFEIETLLDRSGFRIETISIVPGDGYGEWIRDGQSGAVQIGGLHISGMSSIEAEEFFVYQYLVEATPDKPCNHGLTSIVIPTWNEVAYTRQCVESIRAVTIEPYELIVVDNGSTDGTLDYLRSLAAITLIENGANRGFPAAVNQGIRASQGNQILLLNNDVVVTSGWLKRLLAAMYSDSRTGLAGPCTNWPECGQQVDLGYTDMNSLERRAWDWSKREAGRVQPMDELLGFCLLIRKELIDRVGLFDESFGIGLCEDKDYSRRSSAAGYRNVLTRDAYVHHFGHRTFIANGVDSVALFAENRRKFHDRWDQEGLVDHLSEGAIRTSAEQAGSIDNS